MLGRILILTAAQHHLPNGVAANVREGQDHTAVPAPPTLFLSKLRLYLTPKLSLCTALHSVI